jgi:hypothetical protein
MAESTRDPLERGGVDTLRVVAIAVGLLVFLAVSMAVLAWIYFAAVPAEAIAPAHLPAPEATPDQGQQIHALLEQQRQRLNTGAMPIDKAMAAVAAKGAQAYDPVTAPAQGQP